MSSTPPGPRPASPYSPMGPTALARLGVDVFAPARSLRPTWERLLPEATAGGYFAAVRDAIANDEVAAGDGPDQLRWLAEHIRIPAPSEPRSFPALSDAWRRAADTVGGAPCGTLTVRGTRALLDALLRLPDYHARLTDAFAEAFRAELKR